jgi:hypothetical protein
MGIRLKRFLMFDLSASPSPPPVVILASFIFPHLALTSSG